MAKIRKALIKLFIATIVLAGLSLLCLTDINGGLKGVLIVFIVIVAAPVTLLTAIDASRTIKVEVPSHKSLRVVGRLFAFPLAILGTILIGFSLVYPIFGIRELVDDASKGNVSVLPIVGFVIAALSFVVGLRYIREGLGMPTRKSQ